MLSCLASGPLHGADPSLADEQRHRAVAAARDGDLEGARQQLEALLVRHPGDTALRLDLAVVAAWGGDDARAVALLEPLPVGALPDFVLAAFAKAARNLRHWQQALDLYQALAQRRPADPEPALATALVLADMDRFAAAWLQLDTAHALARDDGARADTRFACGYVAERAGELTRALTCYQQAIELDAGHRDARRRMVLTASALGATRQALEALRDEPDLLDAAERQRLALDAAAMEVRWASLPDPDAPRRHARNALAAQERLPVEPGLATPDTPRARSLRYDRIAALVADYRMAEAAAEFELAVADTPLARVPVYALAAGAQAYAYLEQPAQSEMLYRAALAQAPERTDLAIGLFYALSDQQDYDGARAVAEALLSRQPAWRHPEPGIRVAVPEHARAREAAALEVAFREHYQASLDEFDAMLAVAPANTSLRLSRAQVRRWRGWYDAALGDVTRVRALDPGDPRALLLAAQLDLDTRRYAEAQQALAHAVQAAPDAPGTLDLAVRWQLHDSPQLVMAGDVGRSDGGAFSSRDWRVDTHYYSAPIRHRYRAFVHDTASYGEFDEGTGRDHRLGAGLELRLPKWIARGELYQGLADNDDAGAAAQLRWLPDDHWSGYVATALNTPDMPLRGTRIGVQADAVEAGGSYRWHESREAFAGAGLLNMDDGNLRRWLQAGYRQRVLNAPAHKLVAGARVYASSNSETDRIYYNPAADRELSASLVHEWRLIHRFDHTLTQRLGVEAGDYWQEDFGNGSIWTFFAEHVWQLGPRTSVSYGARTGGRVYDGDREHMAAVYATVEWRP